MRALRNLWRRVWSLQAFILASMLLFLLVSYRQTVVVAIELHDRSGPWAWVPWGLAAAIEIGVLGLALIIANRRRMGLNCRAFTVTLWAMLFLSVTASFLAGVESFAPDLHILAIIRDRMWWFLPLLFSAAVPVLVSMFADQFAVLESERQTEEKQPATEEEMLLMLYRRQPATPLGEAARRLQLSESKVSRLRKRLMETGLLEKVDQGVYLPAGDKE